MSILLYDSLLESQCKRKLQTSTNISTNHNSILTFCLQSWVGIGWKINRTSEFPSHQLSGTLTYKSTLVSKEEVLVFRSGTSNVLYEWPFSQSHAAKAEIAILVHNDSSSTAISYALLLWSKENITWTYELTKISRNKKFPCLPALPPFPLGFPPSPYKHQPSLTLFPLLGFWWWGRKPDSPISFDGRCYSPRRGKKNKRKYSPVQFGYLYSGKVLITWIYSGDNLWSSWKKRKLFPTLIFFHLQDSILFFLLIFWEQFVIM